VGAVYLATLILGLGVLLLQFVMPAADTGGAPELEGDSLDLEHDAGAAHDHDHGHGAADAGAIAIFLSFRFWTYGLMAFGFVGTLLHFLHLSSAPVALGTAAVIGLLSGFIASVSMRALARAQTSSGGEADEAVGRIGRVLLAIDRGKLGKVRVEVHGRLIDLIATTNEERLEGGESVIVDEIRGTTAHVSRTGDSIPPKV
jgi:membrane protein implicated in regulation of membrane protease activity